MNKTERQMRDILAEGRESFGVVSVKAEFEAEGTRIDELLRLLDIARAAGLPVTVKIGGCEANRDLYEAKQIGVAYIVAPMVESPYALRKFIEAKNLVYSEDEREDTSFLVNIETAAAVSASRELIANAARPDGVQGLVFGRVDYVGSLNRSRDDINDDDVTDTVIEVATLCREAGLDLVVGGGVSSDALPALRRISQTHLSRFETRKIVFSGEAVSKGGMADALLAAVRFELLWLLNKRDYYGRLTVEDDRRIEMLDSRWRVLGGA